MTIISVSPMMALSGVRSSWLTLDVNRDFGSLVLPVRLVGWAHMNANDLWCMLGWEFSLMVATVRLINSGLFDELPSLKIHVSRSAGKGRSGGGDDVQTIEAAPIHHTCSAAQWR